ncbi:MAG: hypothetical protein ACNS62_21210 [Candidatus Cyclobacteriaceae bacterium M3_2C_046]
MEIISYFNIGENGKRKVKKAHVTTKVKTTTGFSSKPTGTISPKKDHSGYSLNLEDHAADDQFEKF